LKERGVAVAIGTLWRFFKRRRITRKKKTAHAAEQRRSMVNAAREAWFEEQLDLDPTRIVSSTRPPRTPKWRAFTVGCRGASDAALPFPTAISII
jgi:hypothetical protein